MSALQDDELLTQSEILEKDTLPPAKEADQHSKAEPDEAHYGQYLSQNGSEMAAAMLLISRRAGVLANNSPVFIILGMRDQMEDRGTPRPTYQKAERGAPGFFTSSQNRWKR